LQSPTLFFFYANIITNFSIKVNIKVLVAVFFSIIEMVALLVTEAFFLTTLPADPFTTILGAV